MITDRDNIRRIEARVFRYLSPDDGDAVKIAHRACQDFNDDEMDKALAYVDELGRNHPRRLGAPAAQPVMQPQPTQLPPDATVSIGGMKVRVLSRAYEHIPPKLWGGFAAWIKASSIGTTITEHGKKTQNWYEVKLISDEALSGERIKVMVSYNKRDGELVIYHASPDMVNYNSFVSK